MACVEVQAESSVPSGEAGAALNIQAVPMGLGRKYDDAGGTSNKLLVALTAFRCDT